MDKFKLKLLVSIDDWDKYAEMHGITSIEVEELQENNNWYLKTDKDISEMLIKNKIAESSN